MITIALTSWCLGASPLNQHRQHAHIATHYFHTSMHGAVKFNIVQVSSHGQPSQYFTTLN